MSNDRERVRRAREAYDQYYRNQQQPAAQEAIRRAQEAAARRNEFIQQNLPVYGSATEHALQRLRARGFPGMIAVGSVPVKRKILGIIDVSYPNEYAPILGWPIHVFMGGAGTGLHGVQLSLVVDGSFYEYRQPTYPPAFDSTWPEGGVNLRLSAYELVAQLYDLGLTGPEESRPILERLNTLGMLPTAPYPQDTSVGQ